MKLNKINSLKIMFLDLKHTSVLKGSKYAFYKSRIYYFSSKIIPPLRDYFLNLRNNLPKKRIQIKNNHGIFNFYCNESSSSITSEYYDHHLINWIKPDNSKNAIFVDIGANLGFYSILAKNKYKYNKIYAF